MLWLRAEAIADVAGHALHVEVGRRRPREFQLQIAAHRLAFEPSVRAQRKAGRQVARNALEAAACDRFEIQRGVAADGADFNLSAAAGNVNRSAYGFHFDHLGGSRCHAHGSADRGRAQIASHLAGDIAAHRLQFHAALQTVEREIRTDQGDRDGTLLGHANGEPRLVSASMCRSRARDDSYHRAAAAGGHFDPIHLISGGARHFDLRTIPAAESDGSGYVDDLDGALRVDRELLMHRPCLRHRPRKEHRSDQAPREPATTQVQMT